MSFLDDLADFFRPLAAEEVLTRGFVGQKHDDLLDRLRRLLERRFPAAQVTILQGLEDKGVDLIVEQPDTKVAVQLKSHIDISEDGFRGRVLTQIQESRQHGARRLILILCGDCTSRSHRQKVAGLLSNLSRTPEDYVVYVPPENAWALFNPPPTSLHVECRADHAYAVGAHFTGRVVERQGLSTWLTAEGPAVRVVEAIGGSGKSALAWVWANADVIGKPPDDCVVIAPVSAQQRPERVLWWNFYSAGFSLFLEWATEKLGLLGDTDYDRINALNNALLDRRWLLILDGFEREVRAYSGLDGTDRNGAAAVDIVQPHRCISPHADAFLKSLSSQKRAGRVLITSRQLPFRLDQRHRQSMIGLEPADAVQLVKAFGIRGPNAEIEAACRPYDFHALTVCLLAGWLAETPGIRPDVSEAVKFPPNLDIRAEDRQSHVLKLAYNALSETSRRLLGRISCFREAVEFKSLRDLDQNQNETALSDNLRDLIARGLAQRQTSVSGERIDLHPLIRRFAYDHLSNPREEHAVICAKVFPLPDWHQRQMNSFLHGMGVKVKANNLAELKPSIEQCWHTLMSGQYDDAHDLFSGWLHDALYYQFGAYDICIELLRPLFADGEAAPPRLTDANSRGWATNSLGNNYAQIGRPRAAILQYNSAVAISDNIGRHDNLCIDLINSVFSRLALGQLEATSQILTFCLDVNNRRNRSNSVVSLAVNLELSRLFALRGVMDEAAALWHKIDAGVSPEHSQLRGVLSAYRAEAAMMAGIVESAVSNARIARACVIEMERAWYRNERDFIRVDWLEGAALVALGGAAIDAGEVLLHRALVSCRRIRQIEFEPKILLATARWSIACGEWEHAREQATEALELAERCDYRLDQADAYVMLAELWRVDDCYQARTHAEKAKELAWCDGAPFSYHWALQRAETLLADI